MQREYTGLQTVIALGVGCFLFFLILSVLAAIGFMGMSR